MKIQEKIVEFPNRRSVVEIDGNGDAVRNYVAEIKVDETVEGEITETGTPMDAELIEQVNARSDKSLEFKVHEQGDTEPTSKPDAVQIFTKADGRTMLIPAGDNTEAIEIGRTTEVFTYKNNVFTGVTTFANQVKLGETPNQITITATVENDVPVLILG